MTLPVTVQDPGLLTLITTMEYKAVNATYIDL